jgi:hypothetical protein
MAARAIWMMRVGVGHGHPRVLLAVGLAGGDAHAEQLHAARLAAVQPLLVEDQARESHPRRLGAGLAEPLEQLVRVGHLGNFLRIDKRAELDDVHARLDQRLDPGQLVLERHRLLLGLQAVPQPHFLKDDFVHDRRFLAADKLPPPGPHVAANREAVRQIALYRLPGG